MTLARKIYLVTIAVTAHGAWLSVVVFDAPWQFAAILLAICTAAFSVALYREVSGE